MAAKRRTLAEAAKDYQPKRQGYPAWYEVLKQKNPDRLAEINDWIRTWEGGGCRDKFDSRNKLAIFIARNSEGLVKNAPSIIKYMDSGLWQR